MASNYQLMQIKKWTPRAALVAVILLLILFFLGMGYLLTRFLDTGSYFAVTVEKTSISPSLLKEKESEIKKNLSSRNEKRQFVSKLPEINAEEKKDPFNLP